MECTNESRGWHLHFHLLVDADFIPVKELAKAWAKFSGDGSHIVYIKDVRDKSYRQEVCKYAVKGSELAGWSVENVCSFVRVFEKQRTFGVFGSFFKLRAQWKQEIQELRDQGHLCKCGCTDFVYMDKQDMEFRAIQKQAIDEAMRQAQSIQPTLTDEQLELIRAKRNAQEL